MLLAVDKVLHGALTVGDLVLINAYIIQVVLPLNTLGFIFRESNDAMTNVERLFALLDAKGRAGEDDDAPGASALRINTGTIAFENVNFSYDPSRQTLWDVSFHVGAGQTVAVVGGSGSGKSTLARLLFRLYQPDSGRILIDGQDLRLVTQRSLREAVGIVPQDTILFNDTIAYNIAYGREGATRADVVDAARAAQLDTLVDRLPDGYDTMVGERGVRLSGGERQRVAIARAMLRKPPIIVFDEATSALDSRTERAIQQELAEVARGRTALIIAHRLSTIATRTISWSWNMAASWRRARTRTCSRAAACTRRCGACSSSSANWNAPKSGSPCSRSGSKRWWPAWSMVCATSSRNAIFTCSRLSASRSCA